MTSSQVAAAYTEWATTYDTDRNLTRDLDEQVTRAILGVQRYHAILECGCGTGKNTGLLASLGEQVLALDLSDGMLARARAKGFGPSVSFARADITRPWPCADRSVDLVTCNLILEHIEDLQPIVSEAARTLTPSGHLFICELHPFKQYEGTKANFQRDQTRTELTAFVHHVSDFLDAAHRAGLRLINLREWWHTEDQGRPPRLLSLLFAH